MTRSGSIALALCAAVPFAAARAAPAPRAEGSFTPRGERLYSGVDDAALIAIDLFANFALLAADIALTEPSIAAPQGPLAPPDDRADLDEDAPAGGNNGAAATGDRSAAQARDGYRQEEPPPWGATRRYHRRDARTGFLFSFGLGGAGLHVSPQSSTGAFDFDLRMGYGFSDRFQFFGDLAVDSGQYPDGTNVSSWMLTARGQTVLVGDRDGNGLNVNAGVGLGGISRSVCGSYCGYYGYDQTSAAGFAAGAGLSYDARLGQSFRLSPEFFVNWHRVPNDAGRAADIATAVGLRVNFLWYVQ